MNPSLRRLPALAGVLIAMNASAFAAAPQVEEAIIGPTNAGGIYTLSPRGGHIAYAGMKGTSSVVSIDGVDGPAFDELFGPTGQSFFNPQQVSVMPASPGGQTTLSPMMPVIFTADGAHYAYAARSGKDYVVIHDGNEIARGPRESLALNYGPLTLSPTGRHVYWDEARTENSRGSYRLMMSGKPGPWSGHQTMNPVFSADDSHYAYNAGKPENYQEQLLIVDGKDVGYGGRDPVFTADGKILLSIRHQPTAAVLVDGKPVITGISVDKIIPAPTGRRWGAIVRTKIVNSLGVSTFFLDGKAVPDTDGAKAAWFSPDGKHYAVACVDAASKAAYMVVDGKAGKEFQAVTDSVVLWTPDGSKIIYTAVSGGRNFIVVNDEVFPITSLMGHKPVVTPEVGNRYGFATYDGTNRIFTLVIDGKPVLLPSVYPVSDTLTFSPDGSRYAYFFGPIGRSEITGLALDGNAVEGMAPVYFGKWLQMELVAPSFVFSRDGKQVAYQARGSDPKTQGLYVNGKLAFPTQRAAYFPTFTPDGQHLFWAVSESIAGKQPALVAYADGREAVRANGHFFSNSPGTWTMNDQGVVNYFAADGDVVKRYRISAAADSTLATMVSDLSTAQTKALADANTQKKAAEEAALKAKADKDAAAAKAKADYDAAIAAKTKARQDALDARRKAATDAAAAKAKAREDALKARQQGQ